jgi:uncharacterized RDD family membrane protein YckC
VVSPPVEGALAPEPATATPPAKAKTEPLREIPGLRKRERTWKDEVRDKVRDRKRKRTGRADLPLFEQVEEAPAEAPLEAPAPPPPSASERRRPELEDVADLPLRPSAPLGGPDREIEPAPRMEREEPSLEEAPPRDEEWSSEAPVHAPEVRPVERPARFLERLRAGAIDLALLAGLWCIVVYFAGRAAHVPLLGLVPRWPYLGGYLVFLGLVYAAYFTGTTGQTLGKMVGGLRVVDRAGRPPGYTRALLRAAVGSVGVVLAGLGAVPMALDPARRALHDRLFRTRVIFLKG